jgi:mannitol-1-phosphate/altronate dehydrogenase
MAGYFVSKCASDNIDTFVDAILAAKNPWGADLSAWNGFGAAIKENIQVLERHGVLATLAGRQIKTIA